MLFDKSPHDMTTDELYLELLPGGLTFTHLHAYALGYFHARAHGEEKNPYIHELPDQRHLYKCGYDAGLADFCALDMEPHEAKEI